MALKSQISTPKNSRLVRCMIVNSSVQRKKHMTYVAEKQNPTWGLGSRRESRCVEFMSSCHIKLRSVDFVKFASTRANRIFSHHINYTPRCRCRCRFNRCLYSTPRAPAQPNESTRQALNTMPPSTTKPELTALEARSSPTHQLTV